MKGILIRTDSTIEEVEVENTWQAVTDLIGGYMEIVRRGEPPLAAEGVVMVVDEEGIMKRRDYNPLASYLYGEHRHGQPILGDVLIVGEQMGHEGADFVDVPEGVEGLLRRALAHLS